MHSSDLAEDPGRDIPDLTAEPSWLGAEPAHQSADELAYAGGSYSGFARSSWADLGSRGSIDEPDLPYESGLAYGSDAHPHDVRAQRPAAADASEHDPWPVGVDEAGYGEPSGPAGRHRADDDDEPAYLNPGSAYGGHAEPDHRVGDRDDHDLLASHYLSTGAPGCTDIGETATFDESRYPGLGTVERSYAETLYPRLAASARNTEFDRSPDLDPAAEFDRVVEAQDPVPAPLQFSGPRFDPLPAADFDQQPLEETDFSLEPVISERGRAHSALNSGRHRAEPAALGRHRGERTGFVHSVSGRAVFATAVATALTAGGVGAAATLPADHAETPAPKPTSIRPQSAGTSGPTFTPAADTSTAAGTRLSVDVSTTAPKRAGRGLTASAAAKKAGKKAPRSAVSAKPAGAKATADAVNAPATIAAQPATAFSTLRTSSAGPALLRRIVLPHWVRPGTGYISSGYGPRWGTFHYGVDLAAPYGAPIYSAGDGVVLRTGPASGFGEAIYIQHANGDVTVYGHEETTLVHPGEHVHAGQLIARVGAEGEATGPHLHFEVHKGSEYGPKTDPVAWLADRGVKL